MSGLGLRLRCGFAALACAPVVAGCGKAPAEQSTPRTVAAAIPSSTAASSRRLLDWPEFGLNPQRSSVSEDATGITAANVAHLRQQTVTLPGTVDSSAIYIHAASVAGGAP